MASCQVSTSLMLLWQVKRQPHGRACGSHGKRLIEQSGPCMTERCKSVPGSPWNGGMRPLQATSQGREPTMRKSCAVSLLCFTAPGFRNRRVQPLRHLSKWKTDRGGVPGGHISLRRQAFREWSVSIVRESCGQDRQPRATAGNHPPQDRPQDVERLTTVPFHRRDHRRLHQCVVRWRHG